ncbi:MAG: TetR/AcrR family transcriptional regulator [Dermatophilaceae bacterium]
MPPARRAPVAFPAARGRRAQHSLESILAGAIELLDEAGEGALTFRSLAGRLGGGVGSIYWYVAGKDELIQRAADEVIGRLLAQTAATVTGGDPFTALRTLAMALYATMHEHPWIAVHLMRDVELQPNSLVLYERFGQQVLRLPLTSRERFHAVSAIVNYTTGVGAELGQSPELAAAYVNVDRQEFLAAQARAWLATDPERYPFIHEIAQEFAAHEDIDQFASGLDLLLAGLRLKAG